MENKLFLVTFDIDYTQFLVNANDEVEAISIAHEYNKRIGEINDYDLNSDCSKDYTVEKVDFELLSEIIKRDDIVFSNDEVVVFNG